MPAVCRGDGEDTDLFHCSLPRRMGRSDNVKVNGVGISCEGHFNSAHLKPSAGKCITHYAPIASGSSKVKVNGKGCGRVGDNVSGCTKVGSGSENVFAG